MLFGVDMKINRWFKYWQFSEKPLRRFTELVHSIHIFINCIKGDFLLFLFVANVKTTEIYFIFPSTPCNPSKVPWFTPIWETPTLF